MPRGHPVPSWCRLSDACAAGQRVLRRRWRAGGDGLSYEYVLPRWKEGELSSRKVPRRARWVRRKTQYGFMWGGIFLLFLFCVVCSCCFMHMPILYVHYTYIFAALCVYTSHSPQAKLSANPSSLACRADSTPAPAQTSLPAVATTALQVSSGSTAMSHRVWNVQQADTKAPTAALPAPAANQASTSN